MGKVILVCGKICSGKSYYSNQLKEQKIFLKKKQVVKLYLKITL